MRIYLAARYSRNAEMRDFAAHLRDLGHEVTSRWIHGAHWYDEHALSREERFAKRQEFALEDWADLCAADCVISFTQEPRVPSDSRGGRHVEFGAALALGKRVIVVGWRENVFHCLPQVEFYPQWADLHYALAAEGTPNGP